MTRKLDPRGDLCFICYGRHLSVRRRKPTESPSCDACALEQEHLTPPANWLEIDVDKTT